MIQSMAETHQAEIAHLPSVFLGFNLVLLIFLNLQTFGDALDFCFDGSEEGYRLNVKPMEITHATSGAECALKCAENNGCRSVNFKKLRSCEEMENCELLTEVDSENPKQLTEDEEYDYYILLDCNGGNPLDPTPSSFPTGQQLTNTSLICSNADWRQSFDSKGWSKCGAENLFITGFYRSPPNGDNKHPISLLEEARCCNSSPAYSGQNSQCEKVNFTSSFKQNDTWNVCPMGYFLNGLKRKNGTNLRNIISAHCCKPNTHPDQYGSCYDEDVGSSFNHEGWSNCSKGGYYITGLYRGSGVWLNNIDKFRCCRNA